MVQFIGNRWVGSYDKRSIVFGKDATKHDSNIARTLRRSILLVARGPDPYPNQRGAGWLLVGWRWGWFCPLPSLSIDSSQLPRINHPFLFHRKKSLVFL